MNLLRTKDIPMHIGGVPDQFPEDKHVRLLFPWRTMKSYIHVYVATPPSLVDVKYKLAFATPGGCPQSAVVIVNKHAP